MKILLLRFFGLTGIFILCFSFFLLYKNITLSFKSKEVVTNFTECVAKGYLVMEKHPRVCRTETGQEFEEVLVLKDIEYSNASSSDIFITSPLPNDVVSKEFVIKGEAKGYWFFEGSFPVLVKDVTGKEVYKGIAKAQSEWMTGSFVPFTAEISVPETYTDKAFVVLKKDNPSGLTEHDGSVSFAVHVSEYEENKEQATTTVLLFYQKTGSTTCGEGDMVSVERVIQKTKTPIQDTLQLLLKGELTESEKKEEVTSLFPLESFSLKSASLDNNGALTLIFEDPLFKSSGGSCKVSVLRKQIEMTAKQFSVVNDIVFLPEGVFQP